MRKAAQPGAGPGPNHLNGRPSRPPSSDPIIDELRRVRPGRMLSDKDFAIVRESLSEMNRLAEECMRMTRRIDELEPRFKEAAMRKAQVVVASYAIGFVVLLISLFWSGAGLMLFRIGLTGALGALYFIPVHFFVSGGLREDARQSYILDRKSLAAARKMARLGEDMNRQLRKRLGVERKR